MWDPIGPLKSLMAQGVSVYRMPVGHHTQLLMSVIISQSYLIFWSLVPTMLSIFLYFFLINYLKSPQTTCLSLTRQPVAKTISNLLE